MGKETTCADLSLESLTNFIFAKNTLYSCIMRLKGSIKEALMAFTYSRSFNPFVFMSLASSMNSRCLFGECLK